MVEGFINVMLPKSNRLLQAPTIVEDNNKTTNRNEIGDLDPTAVDNNNNNSVERANTVLKTNNVPGVYVMVEKEERFYKCANNYDVMYRIVIPTHLRKEWKLGEGGRGGTHSPVILISSNLPKPNITGSQKQEL